MLYIARAGSPWRDMPKTSGNWTERLWRHSAGRLRLS
ncbi:MAG: hypothetical protein EKK49_04070 [Rhodocyclaceae bacterium]|nr:MAG: hypothetical protein EKK49_04070 [Rhodocyclaceae bacterium]